MHYSWTLRTELFSPEAERGIAPTAGDASGERTSNTLRAYREIRRRILANEMPPGTQYLEQELAQMLDMSRTPVREALIRLAEERLIEVRPRHGARVLPVSADDMREIYAIIAELEAMAARTVAERAHPDVLADLAASAAAMERNSDDLHRWFEHDRRFHHRLVEASGNTRLIEMVRTLADQSYRACLHALSQRPLPSASNADHMALIDAIRRRDPAEAHRVHHAHCVRAGQMLTEILSRLQANAG